MKVSWMARRLLLCGGFALASLVTSATAGECASDQCAGNEPCCSANHKEPSKLSELRHSLFRNPFGNHEDDCVVSDRCVSDDSCRPDDCLPAVYEGDSRSTITPCWFDKGNWFGKKKTSSSDCAPGQPCGENCTHGGGWHGGAGQSSGHGACLCGSGCKCGGAAGGHGGNGAYGNGYGQNGHGGYGNGAYGNGGGAASDCRCGAGCRCRGGNGAGFLADLNGDGQPDSVGDGQCRHCGQFGTLYGLGHCGICCGLPIGFPMVGLPVPGLHGHLGLLGHGHGHGAAGRARDCFSRIHDHMIGGRDGALGGCYSRVYAVNPYHHDFRDGAVYAAQGYNAPISVPLAPNVDHQWNYGWGIPSSRLTPVSRVVPSPYAVQPSYAVPAGYAPLGGYGPVGGYSSGVVIESSTGSDEASENGANGGNGADQSNGAAENREG